MSTNPTQQLSITRDQVNAFRLSRHQLSERASKRSLLSVAYDMAGAQAQLLSAAQISLGARVRDLQVKDVGDAINKRRLVKTSCMRHTLFLVPAKHLAVFARGSTRRAQKEINWALKKGVPERVIDAVIDVTLGIMDKPLTRTEIAEHVSLALGVQKQDIHGGGWGSRKKVAAVPVGHLTYPVVSLLHVVAARGVVCYGPYQDNEPTFVRADAWIPKWKDLSQPEAEGILLRKYLQAFGPGTAADFASWAGMSQTEAREVWGNVQSEIASVDVVGQSAGILKKDLKALAQAEIERPLVRLLPYFDTFILGHKQRQHVDKKHHAKVYRPQGWISPVVLVDGYAAAIWKHTLKGERLQIQVEKFGPLSKQIVDGIHTEAQDLGRFLGASKVEVRIG